MTEPLLLKQRLVAMGARLRIAGTLGAVAGGQEQKRGIRTWNTVCTGITPLPLSPSPSPPLCFRKPELLYSQPPQSHV